MISRLKKLQANKGQFSKGGELFDACKSNSDLRNEIEFLSKHFLNRNVSGCQNCYMDAYLQLINLKITDVMKKIECGFKLRAGALLRDAKNYDVSLNCTNLNITTELALYHLKTNPGCKKYFEKLPDDWEEQVKKFKGIGVVEPELTEEEKAAIEAARVAQEEAETACILEIAGLLKEKVTKTAIKEKYKGVEKVGTKRLTTRLLQELIEKAETLELPDENQNKNEGTGVGAGQSDENNPV